MWTLRTPALIALSLSVSSLSPELVHAYSQNQFESVTSGDETKVNEVREKEINQLKVVLGRRFAESRRPDILLRLAELYIEKYRFYFLKENQIHQQMFKQGLKPKKVDTSKSKGYLRSSTNVLLSILKSKVQYEKLDQVYYYLGYNSEEIGNRKEAVKYFGVVASRYPNSAYAPEAFRNLAEAAFEDGKFNKSVSMYEQAARYNKVPSYPRTLYKLAWSYFKTRRKSEALDTMKKAIELSGRDEKFISLRDEAMNDLVMFYAEAGRSREAHEYFSKVSGGPEIYVHALGRLAKAYDHRGNYRQAIQLNETLISEYGEKRPELVYDVLSKNAELYRKLGDAPGEEAALNRLVQFFAKHSSDIGKNGDSKAVFAQAKGYLRGRATDIHKEAQKRKDKRLYSRAADLYGLYLKAFLSDPQDDKEKRELSEVRTYRSDALLAAGRETEALGELDRTLREPGDLKNRRESGATLLNLLIKRIDADKGKTGSETEKQFLSAAEEFESVFPDDKLVAELRYKKARLIAMKAGNGKTDATAELPKDARRALTELIEKYPSRPEAVDAARDLVSEAVRRKDMDEATKLSKAYLANSKLMGADKKNELEKYLKSVVTHQSFTNVQEVEKDKDYLKAAAEYERLAASNASDSEVSFKALNNAAVNYERAGRIDEAVRVSQQMLAKFPKNSGPREELKRLASLYLWNSKFNESAKLYAKLASMPNFSNEERYSFMRTAFSLYWGTQDLAGAFVEGSFGLREFCKKYDSERCHELSLDLAKLLIEAKRTQEALDHLKRYVAQKSSGTRKAEANFLIAGLYSQNHDTRKANSYYEEASQSVSKKKGSGRASERNFAAHAAFLLVEPYFTSFNALKLELPEDRMKVVTRKKLDSLESLVTRYLSVVNYGDGEWGIAALERLYDAFSGFAGELERAPVPPRIQGDKVELYRRGLRQVSEPMATRALEYLRQGYQTGLQLSVTTSTYIALTQRLSRRLPTEYPPAHYTMIPEAKGESALRLLGPATGAENDNPEAWRKQVASKLIQNPKLPDTWVEFGNLEALSGRLRLARLMYEQALGLSPKNVAALSNLSVVLFLEQHNIEATQGFTKAAEIAEFNKDLKFNLAKAQLSFHHFRPALENLRALSARYPDDNEVTEALAVAVLGSGQVAQAGTLLEKLDAKGSKRFSLWYNWCVWALLSGDKDKKEDALELLKERGSKLEALEKSQVELVVATFGGKNAK